MITNLIINTWLTGTYAPHPTPVLSRTSVSAATSIRFADPDHQPDITNSGTRIIHTQHLRKFPLLLIGRFRFINEA